MVYESVKEKTFLENISYIVLCIAALTFVCSLMYNHIYFVVLGVDISLVPLTIMDYQLTFKEYLFLLTLTLLPFLSNFKNIRQNYLDTRIVTPANRNLDKKTKKILYVICLFSILPIWTIHDAYIHKNYFYAQPLFLAILLIPVIVGTVIFASLSRQKSAFLVLLTITIFSAVQLWHISRDNIIIAFEEKNYINRSQSRLFIIRVLEKGLVVSDENYNLSFRYLENKEIIPFKQNKQLIEFLKQKTFPEENFQNDKKNENGSLWI